MKRKFLLPTAISAVAHLGVLFGVRPIPVRAKPQLPTEPRSVRLMEMPQVPQVPIDLEAPGHEYASEPNLLERLDHHPHLLPPDPLGDFAPPSRVGYETPCSVTAFVLDLPLPRISDPYDADALYAVNELDRVPRALFQTAPIYPYQPVAGQGSGRVLVEFTVEESGVVRNPRVVESTAAAFSEASLLAVARWRFEPGTRAGRIVRFRMTIPFVFMLNDSP